MDDNTNEKKPVLPKIKSAGSPPKIRLTPPTKINSDIPRPKIKLSSVPMEPKPTPAPTLKKVQATTPPVATKSGGKPTIKLARPIIKKTPETVTVPPLDAPNDPSITTRIATAKPKTIKIKRPSATMLSPSAGINEKKETSRVDVSKALAETAKKASPPKTIKLKRPGTATLKTVTTKPRTPPSSSKPTLKTVQKKPTLKAIPKSKIEVAKKNETSRIELPPEAMAQAPATKNTVQIKRPSTSSVTGKKTFKLAKPSSKTTTEPELDPFPDVINIEPEETTVVFSLISLIATLVVCVLLYLLATQTIAPNLPWPGKM